MKPRTDWWTFVGLTVVATMLVLDAFAAAFFLGVVR